MVSNFIMASIRLIRPKQWIKNLFAFAALIFAKELFTPDSVLTATRAFAAFCVTASTIYIINDVMDVAADRLHPVKRNRPIASGEISIPAALGIMTLLIGVDMVLVWGMEWRFAAILMTYAILNVLYSFKLKQIVLLDVFIIAAGFMFRVVGGAVAIGVTVSSWLVLCTLFISLFLGFAKRRAELLMVRESGSKTERKVLAVYQVGFLDQMLTIAAAGAVISYALYTVAPRTIETFGTDTLIYTTIFVCYGVFRYLFLIHSSSETENPTAAVTSDTPTLVTVGLWIISCIGIIYTGGHLR